MNGDRWPYIRAQRSPLNGAQNRVRRLMIGWLAYFVAVIMLAWWPWNGWLVVIGSWLWWKSRGLQSVNKVP